MAITRLNLILGSVLAASLLAIPVFGQTPVTVTIDSHASGQRVPDDFAGLSFEMQYVLARTNGTHLFSPDNTALIRTFKTLGIRSLRVGGNTADRPTVPVPTTADADALFGFAKAAGVKVIYTLRLKKGNVDDAVAMARYIQQNYGSLLAGFAIGNEPDVFSKDYTVYRDAWKKFADAIEAAAPGAKFCGPASTPDRVAWSARFADDFGKSGLIALITQHDYPGGDSRRATNTPAARTGMLSPRWPEQYGAFHDAFAPAAASNGLPFRIEEANSFYNGGALDVSDTFAAALWSLDYLHWWAAHDGNGVNFHTGDKVAAGDENRPCRYAAFWTAPDGCNVHPVGYGLKAFELGGHGAALPVTVTSTAAYSPNLTAYALVGEDGQLWVTLINKEHGDDAHEVGVTLNTGKAFKSGKAIFLTAPGGDVAAKTGIVLGGSAIGDDASWKGSWTKLKPESGQITVKIPRASAAIVNLVLK